MIDARRIVPLVAGCTLLASAHAQVGPGDTAPPITIEALTNAPEGADASWESLGEGVVVVEFWGTWCSPCVAAIPHMNELQESLGDRVTFLSVTYETPEVIDAFREPSPMRSWIGHDTDRSMVRAYGVRSWPTTFVVRDGVVVARAHPMTMTEARLRTYIEDGAMDDALGRSEHDRAREVGEDGRPPQANEGIRGGVDPYSVLVDEAPEFQLIIRRAGDETMSAYGNDGQTMLNVTLREMFADVWGVRPHFVVGPSELDEERRDVIIRVPEARQDELMPMVRTMIGATLGYEVVRSQREVTSWTMRVAPEGLKLKPVERSGGSGASLRDEEFRYTSAGSWIRGFANTLSNAWERPVIDETGLDGLYFFDVTLPRGDDEENARALREKTGLLLEPSTTMVDVVVVTRSGG